MSIFEKSLEKGAGVFLHAASLATEKPLSLEEARVEAKQLLYVEPQAKNLTLRRSDRAYTINDFDYDVRAMKSGYPHLVHEIDATDVLVDEIIHDGQNSHESMQRAAKLGAELLVISREHAEQ